MMKKSVVMVINLLSLSCLLNGMELHDVGKEPKEVKLHSSTTGMHLNLAPEVLLSRPNLTGSNSATARTPISGMHHLEDLLKARSILLQQKTDRSSMKESSTVKRGRLESEVTPPSEVRITISGVNGDPIKEMMSHSTDVKGLEELLDEKIDALDEKEKWALLARMNRGAYDKVYDFAQSHGKSFDDAMIFVELLEKYDFEPNFVVEHVKHTSPLNKKTATGWEVKHYKDLQGSDNEKDKEKYEGLVLTALNQRFDKADGKEQPPTVQDEHLVVQEKKIEEQDFHFKISMIGHAFHILFTAAIGVWAAWAEVQARLPHNGTAG